MAKKKPSEVLLAYRACFNTKAGRDVLLDLMKTHHMLDSTYKPNDQVETIRREGERNVVLRILHFLNFSPTDLDEIMKEEMSNE